jgi:hypothetical protein
MLQRQTLPYKGLGKPGERGVASVKFKVYQGKLAWKEEVNSREERQTQGQETEEGKKRGKERQVEVVGE